VATLASPQKMAGQDYCAEYGKGKENKPEHGVDEAEEVRADAVRNEPYGDGQRSKPGRQAGSSRDHS